MAANRSTISSQSNAQNSVDKLVDELVDKSTSFLTSTKIVYVQTNCHVSNVFFDVQNTFHAKKVFSPKKFTSKNVLTLENALMSKTV